MNIHKYMPTKKAMKFSANIHKFIQATRITTTSEVAKKLNISWNTAEKRLLELALENKIERMKKAGVNLWVLK